MAKRKIKKRAKEIELEDIFLDKRLKERQEGELEKRKIEEPLKKSNLVLLLGFAFLVFLGFLGQSIFFIIFEGGNYQTQAQENKYAVFRFTSARLNPWWITR